MPAMLACGWSRIGLGTVSLIALAAGCALAGCSSGPVPEALQNKVFYQYDSTSAAQAAKALEAPYPSLDKTDATAPLPQYMGVSLLQDAVRMSRPKEWVIRSGSVRPEHRYIEYVSPHEYMVSVYELVESPLDPWLEIMTRYEDESKKAGAAFVGERIPFATWNAQGRAYTVRRAVAAAKAPLVNFANEYLLRSDNRVVLLQIVHHSENLAPMDDELRRVVETFQVN
jgi:hypothetical protein